MSFKWPSKAPDEIQDYSLDWSRLIATSVMITGVTYLIEYEGQPKVAFPTTGTVYGLTHNANSVSGKVTTIFLAGGELNRNYKIYCQITDSLGRVTERAVTISMRNR
ncbi:MAG: hypothetical protein ACRCT2_01195 [Plesiomonas shigelloides]